MHLLMVPSYSKFLLGCSNKRLLAWCSAGRPKVPRPLASVPKKSVVKLKRDTAKKAGNVQEQVFRMP